MAAFTKTASLNRLPLDLLEDEFCPMEFEDRHCKTPPLRSATHSGELTIYFLTCEMSPALHDERRE